VKKVHVGVARRRSHHSNPCGIGLARTDAFTRATDAQKLPVRLFLIGRELHPIDGHYGVKAFIRERQRLDIGDAKVDDQPLRLCPLTGPVNQRRDIVDPGDLAVPSSYE
jgi:hypothetical protein